MPSTKVKNLAVAGALGAFVAGTYMYTMRAVGQDDLAKELEREAARLAREEDARATAQKDGAK